MEILEQTKQICLQLYLPNEIVNRILEYYGYHIWRNGKFICRLNINDKKYNNLKNLNIIKKIKHSYKVTIPMIKNRSHYKYIIEQSISSNMIHWYMYKYWCHSIHPKQKTYNKPYIDETNYVFGKHISQKLLMLRMDYTDRK